jgi:peptidyl-prolyl cis-trans isomerase C
MHFKFRMTALVIVVFLAAAWSADSYALNSASIKQGTVTGNSATTNKKASTKKNSARKKGSARKKSTTSDNEKVAIVNGVAISKVQYDRLINPIQNKATLLGKNEVTDEQIAQAKNKIIDNLIATELLYQECKKEGIKVNDKEVLKTFNQQKAQFKSNEAFRAALIESNYNEGLLKNQIKIGLTIQHYIDQNFAKKTVIPDEDVKQYYDEKIDEFKQPAQIRASHILILVPSDTNQEKKETFKKDMEAILQRLKAGEDFVSVAKEVSQDPSTKEKGGDLGFFTKGQMVKSFEDAAFALGPGELSDIVETEFGFHIIKVTEKKEAKTVSLDEAKEGIRSGLKSAKVNSDVNKYIAELRSKAKIEIFIK